MSKSENFGLLKTVTKVFGASIGYFEDGSKLNNSQNNPKKSNNNHKMRRMIRIKCPRISLI